MALNAHELGGGIGLHRRAEHGGLDCLLDGTGTETSCASTLIVSQKASALSMFSAVENSFPFMCAHFVVQGHYLTETDLTFLLTSVGHNAGIVSEPGHPHRHFRIATRTRDDVSLGPDEWVKAASQRRGSWCTNWAERLAAHSAAERVMPPAMGRVEMGLAPLYGAPGTYVLQR